MRAQRGFSLVEILVAVSLLALMTLGAMAALTTSVRAVRSGEAQVNRSDSVRIAQEFMRRQLSQAMALPFERAEDLGMVYVFEGDANALRFVAPMPGHLSRGGPHVQQLSLVRDGRTQRLEFSHDQLNGYEPERSRELDARPPVIVLEGITNAHFEYRAADENGELMDWRRDWEYPQFLPMMVRLVAEFPADRRQTWPLLEIPLHAGANGGVSSFYGRQPYAPPDRDPERRIRRPPQ